VFSESFLKKVVFKPKKEASFIAGFLSYSSKSITVG